MTEQQKIFRARWNDSAGSGWGPWVGTPSPSPKAEDRVAWSCRRLHWCHGCWHESEFVGVQFVTQCWRDRNSPWPLHGHDADAIRVCILSLLFCLQSFLLFCLQRTLPSRSIWFHCSFPLIKRALSAFAGCIHLVSVLKLIMGDFLPKVHYLRVRIPRNLVPSNTSFLKFKQ